MHFELRVPLVVVVGEKAGLIERGVHYVAAEKGSQPSAYTKSTRVRACEFTRGRVAGLPASSGAQTMNYAPELALSEVLALHNALVQADAPHPRG
jgi:hypothetical protein